MDVREGEGMVNSFFFFFFWQGKDFWEEVSNRHLEIWSLDMHLGATCNQMNTGRVELLSEVQWQTEFLELPGLNPLSRPLLSRGSLPLDPWPRFPDQLLISDCGP